MWDSFDTNNTGHLSLEEVDRGIREVLQCDYIFDAKPVITRAFVASQHYGGVDHGANSDFVEQKEFRVLLMYLYLYFQIYEQFEMMDPNHDRRLTLDEFAMALPLLEDWGVSIPDDEIEDTFRLIDRNRKGMILLEEFCDWALLHHMATFLWVPESI